MATKRIKLAAEIAKKCAMPLLCAAALVFFYSAYLSKVKSGIAINWNNVIEKIFFSLAVLIIAYWLKMIVSALFAWYGANIAAKTGTSLDEEFIPLFRRVVSLLIWIVGAIIILSYLGINITALITALGVGSLAIALAAQDTIANIIAGFLIMVDRPFKVGDRIKLPTGETAQVVWIGNRRSKFKTDDGALVIVPNLDLSKSRITNYTTTE